MRGLLKILGNPLMELNLIYHYNKLTLIFIAAEYQE